MWKLKVADDGPREWRAWLTTDYNHIGRQHWEFDPHAGTPEEHAEIDRLRDEYKKNRFSRPQSSDHLMRMQMRKEKTNLHPIPAAVKVGETQEITDEAVETTLRRAISYFASIQAHDGHWPGDTAAPLFFLPPLVFILYITGDINIVLSAEHQREIKRYIYNHQNEDGGWGLHILGPSTVFGSMLNYIALRLLGEGSDGQDIARGRKWILDHGGAVAIPSWGKFWLTVLGVYEWEGCNPTPPELWMLPKILPFHPGNTLCYCRLVYMPMSYIFGKRFVGRLTPLVHELRDELYTQSYNTVNWNKARNTCAKEDLYYPHPWVQDLLWGFIYCIGEPILSRWPFSKLREKAMKVAMQHIHYEDEESRYIGMGCVEKVMCMLACWIENPNSEAYKCHLARLPDYYWVAEDGLKFQGIGSQTWDASLSIIAIISSNLGHEYNHTLHMAHDYLKESQMRENPKGNFEEMYRNMTKGAWTFSTPDHSWQVSDTTAEGLKAILLLSKMSKELVGEKLEAQHVYDAVHFILSSQSKNGGFCAWETRRADLRLEVGSKKLNPTEIFEGVMVDKEYVECTSSAIQALTLFKKLYPGHRRKEIRNCISKATCYLLDTQNPDGSWTGFWGICYTYGTWFGVEGLVASGKNYDNCPALQRACKFLLSKQLSDGGWGESYLSSYNKVYTNIEGNRSNLVQTSWALMALIKAGQVNTDSNPIHKGVRLLINIQEKDGDFPQQDVTGVFMKSCIYNYASYRNIFPIRALGEYRHHVLQA